MDEGTRCSPTFEEARETQKVWEAVLLGNARIKKVGDEATSPALFVSRWTRSLVPYFWGHVCSTIRVVLRLCFYGSQANTLLGSGVIQPTRTSASFKPRPTHELHVLNAW